jgi:hypothetical protein
MPKARRDMMMLSRVTGTPQQGKKGGSKMAKINLGGGRSMTLGQGLKNAQRTKGGIANRPLTLKQGIAKSMGSKGRAAGNGGQ